MNASIVLAGCFLLLLLAGLRLKSVRLPFLLGIVVPAVLWLAAVTLLCPLPGSYPESPAGGLTLEAVRKLDPRTLAGARYVFVIEGSSVTTNGLDGDLVQTRLNQRGIPAIVVQLSAPGASHAERYEFLREFVHALSPAQFQRLRQLKVVLCREVEPGYDRNPFNNLLRNGATERAMRCLLPANLPTFVRWMVLKYSPGHWVREHTLLTTVAGSELFNAFHIGYLQRLANAPAAQPEPAFSPRQTQEPGFAPSGPLYPSPEPPLDEAVNQEIKENAAWERQRDADFRNVFRGLIKAECSFALPTWDKQNMAYNAWKLRTTRDHLFFYGAQTPLADRLNDPALWFDDLHLLGAGARLYSETFADYLTSLVQRGKL